MTCHCGCGGEATWLITGNDYDPRRLFGVGDPFVDEPACDHAAAYCEEAATHVGLPFLKRPITSAQA